MSRSPLTPAVSSGGSASGALTYRLGPQSWLAGYANLPNAPWTVVVEQPASAALADVRTNRELLFGVLLLALALAAATGVFVAAQVGDPGELLP